MTKNLKTKETVTSLDDFEKTYLPNFYKENKINQTVNDRPDWIFRCP